MNPEIKNLFLLDGIGALLSAFLLGGVLVYFNEKIGMPIDTLYLLAALPCLFAIYDFYCLSTSKKNSAFSLKCIAFANIAYCILSLALLIYHLTDLTSLGIAYFTIEIIVVFALAVFELKVANSSFAK